MTSVNSVMNYNNNNNNNNNNKANPVHVNPAPVPKLRPAGYKPPTTTEKLRPQDGAVRSHMEIGQSGADYVQYINSPSLGRDRPQQMTHVYRQQQRQNSQDTGDTVQMADEAD